MDIGKYYAQGEQQESSLPTSAARPAGANAAQGETSEKGFYLPPHLSRSFNGTSSLAPSLSFSVETREFPSGSSLMSRDESLSDPPGLHQQTSPTTGAQVWNSTEHTQSHLDSSALRSQPLVQSNPQLFGSGASAGPPVSDAQQGLQSLFPVNFLPTQFASSGPLYTHHDSLVGQSTSLLHSSHPFRNTLSQSYVYAGYHPHPVDSGQYPPTVPGYFPIPQQNPQAYFPQRLAMESGNPSYPHVSRASIPGQQHVTGTSGSPWHTGSYGGQQYPPLLYSSLGHFGLPQQQQPGMYQWYYLPGSSAVPFNKGVPMQFPQRPMNYLQQSQPSLNPDALGGQLMDGPPSPSSKHVGSSGASSTVRNPIPLSIKPPNYTSAPASPADPHDQSNNIATSPTEFHVQERPFVRRHYHPNPPPNRSEWVMWVGNVPNDATHDELWRFLKQPAPSSSGKVEDDGIVSVFLISRSSCAFVNYRSEEHLNRAISRFNGRPLRPHDRRCPRLVCRARRKEDDLRAGVGAQRGMGVHTKHVKKLQKESDESAESSTKGCRSDPCPTRPSELEPLPLMPSASSDEETGKSHSGHFKFPKAATRSSSSYASTSSSFLARHYPRRFFILKSLTQYDLDLSVERGVWATQKHNEAILDQAFRTSKEVILIFGVNKSGEFYGYARMTSRILRSDHSISWASRADSSPGSSSHSSSRVQARENPEESDDPSRSSPTMYTSPSENRWVQDSPLPVMPSPGSPSHLGTGSSKERQSAPPAVNRPPQADLVPDVPLRSSFSCSNKGWPATSGVTAEAVPGQSRSIGLGRYPAVRPAARNKAGGADPSSNPGMALQTVREEMQTGSVEENFIPPVQAGPSLENCNQPEVQLHESREAGWGETFNIEWLSTDRVPFHRIRHLRNPWNHDREIKVSRDGTELEPGVGQELIDHWQWLTLASEPGEGESGRALHSGKRGTKAAATSTPVGEEKWINEAT